MPGATAMRGRGPEMSEDLLPGRLVKLLAEQCYGLCRVVSDVSAERQEWPDEGGILHAWGPMAPHPVPLRRARRQPRRATLPDGFLPRGLLEDEEEDEREGDAPRGASRCAPLCWAQTMEKVEDRGR